MAYGVEVYVTTHNLVGLLQSLTVRPRRWGTSGVRCNPHQLPSPNSKNELTPHSQPVEGMLRVHCFDESLDQFSSCPSYLIQLVSLCVATWYNSP